jgi:hypothetical protein
MRERVRKQQPAAVSEILSAKLNPAPPALGLREGDQTPEAP